MQNISKRFPYSTYMIEPRKMKDTGPAQQNIKVLTNIIKRLQNMFSRIRSNLNRPNSVLPLNDPMEVIKLKAYPSLRNVRRRSFCLIILTWIVAIVTGGTAMVLDLIAFNSDSSSNDMFKMNTPGSSLLGSLSTVHCKNSYLEKLAGRYVKPIMVVRYLNQIF